MKGKLAILVLVVTLIAVISLGMYANRAPIISSDDAPLGLPEKIYRIYGINSYEANNCNSIKLISVNYEGETQKHLCRSYSPVTALIDLGYSISNKNKITSTSPIDNLLPNSYILVETYTTTIDEILIELPYEKIMKGNVLCKKLATKEQEQEGVLGLMTQRIKRVYKGDRLIAEEIIEERIDREPRPEIIIIKGPEDLPDSVPQRGPDCSYWNSYINNINASTEEKEWLKFIMRCESGCNAESNKSFHKGLFQWDPCLWYTQFANDNIFDGEAQIKRTLQKLREGANPNSMWPACHRRYKNQPGVGELSWLQ